eukprot:361089-Chlamydomonas_euryale.AAC.1
MYTAGWPGSWQTTAVTVTGFLRVSQDFLAFLWMGWTGLVLTPWAGRDWFSPHGLDGTGSLDYAVWDFQDPWTMQPLSFKATGSRERC